MDTKKKAKLITVSHTAIGVMFSPGNPSLVAVANFDAAKLSPRLAKVFSKIEKSGSGGVKVKTLDKDDRWSARFLLKIKALRDVPEPKEEKKPKASQKPAKALTITNAAKNRKKNNFAKAA